MDDAAIDKRCKLTVDSAGNASRSARAVGAVEHLSSRPATMVNTGAMPVVTFTILPAHESRLLGSLLSAHGAASDQVHDRQQDNGSKQ